MYVHKLMNVYIHAPPHVHIHLHLHLHFHIYIHTLTRTRTRTRTRKALGAWVRCAMGSSRLVGSIKLQVSFAE